MALTSDWHIHSQNSCDKASIPIAKLLGCAHVKGITDFGVTDHIHTAFNHPELAASRAEFDAAAPSPRVHFGVEVSSISLAEIEAVAAGGYENATYGVRELRSPGCPLGIALTDEDLTAYGIEFVVGGTHWPMHEPTRREPIIRDYHRQNMFLAEHPLVNIVAHPWWWMTYFKDDDGNFTGLPWFDDFGHIPRSMHDEFAAAAIEHDTKVEINIMAVLLRRIYPERFRQQYVEYLAELKSRGVSLALGSDCHDDQYDIDFDAAEAMLKGVGIQDHDLWRLPPRGGK
jgi:histidinol phosphatase-like PHP family hydrolase